MNPKMMGGVLLVVGTTIGAGMLALPIATAEVGFWGSLVLLVTCWAVMTASAFLFLEVNLSLPANSNLVSMAGATLGRGGQVVTWFFYLLLLYSIISAYIAGGGDLFHYLLGSYGLNIPLSLASLLFAGIFGTIVYFGIRLVDYVNRGLMFGKMGAFLLLVLLTIPFVSSANLADGQLKYLTSPSSLTVTAVAFTCAMIIPSLRTYFGDDAKTLRKVIFLGTLIPLLCYIAWDMVIMGIIPLNGAFGLKEMTHSSSANSEMVVALTTLLKKNVVTVLTKFFTSICMATSFLSVSLSLSDFLADGLRISKQGLSKVGIFVLTFAPPIAVVLFYPDAFLRGLNYAGICCLVLMLFMPPLMAWRCRYHYAMAKDQYQIGGGKPVLLALIGAATLFLSFGVVSLLN